jgi:hypothetical protein
VGVAPQIIFNVESSIDRSAATEYDLRARASLQAPATSRLVLLGRVAPGYSIIALPSSTAHAFSGTTVGNPRGLVLDLSAGAAYLVSPRLFLLFEAGYQIGFQRASFTFDLGGSGDTAYRVSYPHVGLGFGVTLGQ